MDHLDPDLYCILVIIPFPHSPTGIHMKREDNYLRMDIFNTQSEKLNTCVENVSQLILKENLDFINYQEYIQQKL